MVENHKSIGITIEIILEISYKSKNIRFYNSSLSKEKGIKESYFI